MAMDMVLVQMAQIRMAEPGSRLKTTLGSCVGVILHDRVRRLSGLAHIMLPERLRDDDSIGKYADTAIPTLLAQLEQLGSRRRDLRAYLAGGANMFQSSQDRRIATVGEKNLAAVRQILGNLGIPIQHEHTGGEQGRTVVFDGHAGELQVKTLQRIAWKGSGQ
jgi:chemotaxis protein CheD